jgi:hypothetical protein
MTPPAFGAHRQGPGTSSVAAARGAFKWRGSPECGDEARAAVCARAEEEEAEDGQVGEAPVAKFGEAKVGAAMRW